LRPAVAGRRAAAGPLLGEHLPPDDQLTDPPLGRQRQQAVVLAVQTHVQQVLFGQMVGNQVGLARMWMRRVVEGLEQSIVGKNNKKQPFSELIL